MDAEVKRKWVQRLRDPKSKKAKSVLGHGYGGGEAFCCLGHLCEIAVSEGVVSRYSNSSIFGEDFLYGAHKTDTYLPSEVIEWAGLTESDPYVDYSLDLPRGVTARKWPSLSMLNDVADLSLPEIADVIEAQL